MTARDALMMLAGAGLLAFVLVASALTFAGIGYRRLRRSWWKL